MPEYKNGFSWMGKAAIGGVCSIYLMALLFIGNNVIANDKEARGRDDEIKKDVQMSFKDMLSMMNDNNKDVIKKLEDMNEAQHEMSAAQQVMALEVKHIKEKVDKIERE